MISLKIQTSKKDEIVDITDEIEQNLKASSEGVCNIFIAHTTAAITTADLDPGTDQDYLNALRHILPRELKFNHPHDPSHTPDHILSTIIGPSVNIPFKDGKLVLGTWQRVILIELDGPRERNVHISLLTSN